MLSRRSGASSRAAALAIVALASLTHAPRNAAAAVVVPSNFVDEILTTGLNEPNSFAFLPDGRLLVTEQRTGAIRLILGDHSLVGLPAYTVEGVSSNGNERGLQGITVDPRWPSPAYAYVQFNRTGTQEWIVRLTGVGNLTDPTSGNLSFTDPLILINNIRDVSPNHNAGTLRFGPDGYLYSTVGEDELPCASQKVDSLLGKLLRLDVSRLPSGPGGPVPRALLIPPDNPLSGADSNARLVYAYGLRNPWRMHIDPESGTVYVADVGENFDEEVNEIVPGQNYGWPFRQGVTVRTLAGCTEPGGPGGSSYSNPSVILSHTNGYTAILSATIYRPAHGGSSNWPKQYWGNLFAGDYYNSRMQRFVKSDTTWSNPPAVPGQPTSVEWSSGMRWVVDFLVGPDGSLYWLKAANDGFAAGTGMVHRIRFTGTTTAVGLERPATQTLRCAPNPFSGHAQLTAAFSPGASVRVTIVDATGRRVSAAMARETEPGRFTWTWDGRDERGVTSPPGIYLAGFHSGTTTLTTHVLRVR
jgi:glucose/arabinose dehydrogenase